MSDISIDIPLWIALPFLGAVYWQVTLAICLLSLLVAVFTRGWARVGAAGLAVALLAELGFAAVWQVKAAREDREAAASEARIHQT